MVEREPTQVAIAKYFDTTPQTIVNWKYSEREGVRLRVKAMTDYYKKIKREKDENVCIRKL